MSGCLVYAQLGYRDWSTALVACELDQTLACFRLFSDENRLDSSLRANARHGRREHTVLADDRSGSGAKLSNVRPSENQGFTGPHWASPGFRLGSLTPAEAH